MYVPNYCDCEVAWIQPVCKLGRIPRSGISASWIWNCLTKYSFTAQGIMGQRVHTRPISAQVIFRRVDVQNGDYYAPTLSMLGR